MITKLTNILKSINEISGWKIKETVTESKELFFVRKNLDMNRAKKVHYYNVVVYRDFEADGKKYTGSSSVKLASNMSDNEIETKIKEAVYAASFVKNEYYPLAQNSTKELAEVNTKFNGDILPYISSLREAAYKSDIDSDAAINSLELFLNKRYVRLVTSEGIDRSYSSYDGEIEAITDCDKGEAVEIFNDILFADFCPELIETEIKEQIVKTKERAVATQVKLIEGIDVIITGDAVKSFFEFYTDQSNAQLVYEKISAAKIGESFQGENIKGDKVNLKLEPIMENSTESAPFDEDGIVLNPVVLFEDGVLKTYHGSQQYSYYLGVEATGNINNVVVSGGKYSECEFKSKPYIELVTFSDFQMDSMTGDFGGEFRLARYFDGEKTIPVTGGSIMGNLFKTQEEIYLSKELVQHNNYNGPKSVMIKNMTVSGAV